MKYSRENEQIIKNGKTYLKQMREIIRERGYLINEYSEEMTPASLIYTETRGQSISQLERFNDYTLKRDMILSRIHMFNEVIEEMNMIILLLPIRQRQIIEIYMNSHSYNEMIQEMEEKYYISVSTYKRELPKICISLSAYVDYENIPTLEKLNEQFYKDIKKRKE